MTTNKRMRQKFRNAKHILGQILIDRDPMGIAFCDTYNLEANTILPLLKRKQTIEEVLSIVYEQFLHWFDDSVGEKSAYMCIAEDVHRDVLPILPEQV